ncbi:hypothetical protein SERLA73DRAFT_84202 [Serpula lacrymans var. lacrymans S7.3]|uniref:Uncharacterized protein n=2 Tax=Serpula lacrymans var. lacrymans TaxID=341189 RepID=F8PL89_SERL3|nr:hypothetical protein SERLA73DRAFT_84202 [Serpula lacrymans var. lacrymans S7.3]
MRPSSFPRSGVLILGQNSIQSLLPSTLISQAESLLDAHKIQDAIDLADQQRKKHESKITVDVGEAEELRYVYQRIGFQCLAETLFEDAGKNLFAGDLDPRVLVSYFPDLRGHLFGEEDGIDLFEGVVEHMPPEASVDEIIAANLVRNYSPHLAPNTREAPPTVELRAILNGEARNMLEVFLRKWRTRRRVEDGPNVRGEIMKDAGEKQIKGKEGQVIDTVLAKIFVLGDKPTDLHALLQDPSNEVILDEIEQALIQSGHFSILCSLYKEKGEVVKLCEAWAKLIEGEWTDPDVLDPLSNMFTLLTEKRDKALIQRWVIWLTKKDPDRALKLLTQRDSNKRQAKSQVEDDLAMLEQLRATNPAAAVQFLEFLVLQRRSSDRSLHMQLALSCVDQLLECLDDEGTLKLWRAKASSFASSASSRSQSPTPFLTYFASTTPDSPAKRIRLKTALYLQSFEYDVAQVREHLQEGMGENEKVLALELAILDGKLGSHRTAISTLVHVLRDTVSAEAYCTHGGRVISPKAALSLVEMYSLAGWAGQSSGKIDAVDDQTKRDLVRLLLEVYMSEGESYHTARLLDSQAMNLDVVDVIPLVPPDWSLNVLSSFLARSFRRTLHAHHEGQIVKAMSSGQNLDVIDKTWLILREQGAIIEEAADDSGGEEEEVDEKSDEKSAFQNSVESQETVFPRHPEKMVLHQELGSEAISVPESGGLDLR